MSYYDVVQLSIDPDFKQRLHASLVAHEVQDPMYVCDKLALWVALGKDIRAAYEYAILDPYKCRNSVNPAVISDLMIDARVMAWKSLPPEQRDNPPIEPLVPLMATDAVPEEK